MKKIVIVILFLSSLVSASIFAGPGHSHEESATDSPEVEASNSVIADEDSHSDEEEGEEGHSEEGDSEHAHEEAEEGTVTLDKAQRELAGIKVETLEAKKVDYSLYAPGEIIANAYTSYRVSPRVPSIVLKRHVALGDHVKAGQAVVTLFSEDVATTQAELIKASSEWQRAANLGRQVVGEKRYVDAQANFEAAQATLQAYGLSQSDIQGLLSKGSSDLGEYTLRAKTSGAVLADEFEQGQRVEAGSPLVTLADEKKVWVEAKLPANLIVKLNKNSKADIVVGDYTIEGRVAQEAHTIDPVTRTRIVRLSVVNSDHMLHPGQFADVSFKFKTDESVMAVPESALMRSDDGDWVVYVQADSEDEFKPVEVQLLRRFDELTEISGIESGARVVSEGAFFVASQMAKGNFDPHNH